MINRNQPFRVKPFDTEWDYWCDHRVPFLNEKFGNRLCLYTVEDDQWQWNDQLIEQNVRENSVINLKYNCFDSHIKLVCFQSTKITNKM